VGEIAPVSGTLKRESILSRSVPAHPRSQETGRDIVLTLVLQLETILAYSVNADFNAANLTGKGLLQIVGVDIHALRMKAVHLTAAGTVKMRMAGMVFIGCQAEMGGPTAGAQALEDTLFHQ